MIPPDAHTPVDLAVNARSTPVRKAIDPALVHALEAHVETLKAQLAAAEGRVSEESAITAQAIAAFHSLAERLEAIAEARRPWWRRLVG